MLFWVPLLVAVAMGAVTTWSEGPADIAATETWPQLPPEARGYLDRLESELPARLGERPQDYGFDAPARGLSLGPPVPAYAMTEEFLSGGSTARQRAFRHSWEWLIPVAQDGRVRNVVSIWRRPGGGWEIATLGHGEDLGASLPEFQRRLRLRYAR